MKTPLTLDENGDVSIYFSTKDLKENVEVIDIKNGEYVGYDAEGRLLILSSPKAHEIEISIAETEPLHSEELAECLRSFVSSRQPRSNVKHLSLAELWQKIENEKIMN
jgi:hypothetical protein